LLSLQFGDDPFCVVSIDVDIQNIDTATSHDATISTLPPVSPESRRPPAPCLAGSPSEDRASLEYGDRPLIVCLFVGIGTDLPADSIASAANDDRCGTVVSPGAADPYRVELI
jgi:hypothetical protein